MFAAFFHHVDTESYATIKPSIDSHRKGGNVRVSQKPGGGNVMGVTGGKTSGRHV